MSDMRFDDNDLKRLKEMRSVGDNHILPGNLVDALLHRLESAERFICGRNHPGAADELFEAWKRSCGR